MFNDFDENQETVVLKHKELGGEDLPDEKQQEPLSMIRKGSLTSKVICFDFFMEHNKVLECFRQKLL